MASTKKSGSQTTSGTAIDRDKLRVALRRFKRDPLLAMLDRAIEAIPPDQLAEVFRHSIEVESLRPDSFGGGNLLASVKEFDAASRRGEYYEDFDVNSKNFMDMSRGTETWMEECNRLLRRAVAAADAGAHVEARPAFEILFALLEQIDQGEDDILFFADEGGAWAVGVGWDVVLPAWFACLAATAAPEELAPAFVRIVDTFQRQVRDRHLKAARAAATPAQRKALADAAAGRKR